MTYNLIHVSDVLPRTLISVFVLTLVFSNDLSCVTENNNPQQSMTNDTDW